MRDGIEDLALYQLLQTRLDQARQAQLELTDEEVAAVVVPPALLAGVAAVEVPSERLWSEDPRSLRLQWRAVAGAVESLTAKLKAADIPLKADDELAEPIQRAAGYPAFPPYVPTPPTRLGLKTDGADVDTDQAAQQRVNPPTAGSVIKDGRLMVDGKSFFPVGAYTHDLSADDWAFMQASVAVGEAVILLHHPCPFSRCNQYG